MKVWESVLLATLLYEKPYEPVQCSVFTICCTLLSAKNEHQGLHNLKELTYRLLRQVTYHGRYV
jgi:hypothetical protein